MARPEVSGFYVAFEGSYEDPARRGGLSGPYPTIDGARDWVDLLNYVRESGMQNDPKRPLYIVRARFRAPQVRREAFAPAVLQIDGKPDAPA